MYAEESKKAGFPFSTFCIAFHMLIMGGDRQFTFGRSVDPSIVLVYRWQNIPERGVVRSREPFKYFGVPITSV